MFREAHHDALVGADGYSGKHLRDDPSHLDCHPVLDSLAILADHYQAEGIYPVEVSGIFGRVPGEV